jgi:two-component system, LytTR family, response regulator
LVIFQNLNTLLPHSKTTARPFQCLIVDDNELDGALVMQYLQPQAWLKPVGTFANPLECMSVFATTEVDVLFLDIDMPVVNGINFIRSLKNPPLCVFITNHPDYATDAFDVQAFDYLLKPVTRERFERTLQRIREYFEIQTKVLHYDTLLEQDTITFKEGTAIAKVATGDIIYLEALANYTKVVTADRQYITLNNLKNFLDALPSDAFMRIHRSYAVAKKWITGLERGEVLMGRHKLPFGKTYRKEIQSGLLEKRVG